MAPYKVEINSTMDGDKVFIYLVLNGDKKRINISDLDIEIVGIRQKDVGWATTIVTNPAMKKTIYGIDKQLKVLDFDFTELKEAILFQSELLMALNDLKKIKDKKWLQEIQGSQEA